MTFGEVKLKPTKYEVETGRKQKKNRKTGKTEEFVLTERFSLHTPYAYDMGALRRKLRRAFHTIASGAKRVEISLYRFPQVHTVIGELKAQFPGIKFSAGWTTDEETNTLFVIKREK